MNKEKLVEEIIESLRVDYREVLDAAKDSKETAIHEENIAKSKYETNSIEAAYLVDGQMRRLKELEMEIAAYQAMKIRSFDNQSRVLLSALIVLEDEKEESMKLFMGPQSGGKKIGEVQIITPPSPIGQAVLGKYCGESIVINEKTYKITKIS